MPKGCDRFGRRVYGLALTTEWPGRLRKQTPGRAQHLTGGVEMADVTAVAVVPEDKPGPTADEILALLTRIDQMHERVTRDLAAWDAEAVGR